ncbi:hypothetical protein AAMO2058_001544000 [Amorphochlora amoebiformis]
MTTIRRPAALAVALVICMAFSSALSTSHGSLRSGIAKFVKKIGSCRQTPSAPSHIRGFKNSEGATLSVTRGNVMRLSRDRPRLVGVTAGRVGVDSKGNMEEGDFEYRFSETSKVPAVAIRDSPSLGARKIGPVIGQDENATIMASCRVRDEEGNVFLKLKYRSGWILADNPSDTSEPILVAVPVEKGIAREKAKSYLLNLIGEIPSGNKHGVGLDVEKREKINFAADKLSELSPVEQPATSKYLNGLWKLLYSTSEAQSAGNLTPGAFKNVGLNLVGDVEQDIDLSKCRYINRIKLGPLIEGSLEASWDTLNDMSWIVRFLRFKVKLFNGAVTSVDQELSGQNTDAGLWEMIYLDNDLRILRARSSSVAEDTSEFVEQSNIYILGRQRNIQLYLGDVTPENDN